MIEGAAASGGEEGQTRGDDEDASRGTRRPSARAPTGRARRRRPRASGEMQTRSLLTHSTWQEKKKENASSATKRVIPGAGVGRRSTDGRRTARARGKRFLAGTYLCGTRARYPDTGRAHEAMDATTSRGLTNLTRRVYKTALFPCFGFQPRTAENSQKTRNFWPERIRAPGENRTPRGYFRRPGTRKTPPGFVTASLFRVFRFSALDVHSHVEILDMRTADAHIRNRSRENLRELRERLTRRADRTRGHLAARDARPRDARARGLESRGLGGGGVSEMHGARYGSAPPSAAATDTASPETTALHGVPCRILYSSA